MLLFFIGPMRDKSMVNFQINNGQNNCISRNGTKVILTNNQRIISKVFSGDHNSSKINSNYPFMILETNTGQGYLLSRITQANSCTQKIFQFIFPQYNVKQFNIYLNSVKIDALTNILFCFDQFV